MFYAKGLHFSGELKEWHGPNVYPDGCTENGNHDTCPEWCDDDSVCGCYGHGSRSMKCRCEQEPISCAPVDGWEQVVQCDNRNGGTPLHCEYKKVLKELRFEKNFLNHLKF